MGVGHSPQELCSHLGVLQTAGVITAHHGNLGLVRVQRLDLKPIFRGGWNGGGVAPCSVLQEGGCTLFNSITGFYPLDASTYLLPPHQF